MSSITVLLVLVVMLVPLAVAVGSYLDRRHRRLVALRRNVDRAWADIDVLLRRRHDQVFDLAETIRAVGGEPAIAIGIASQFAAIEPWLSRADRFEVEQRINLRVARLLNLLSYHPHLRRNERFAVVRQQFRVLDQRLESCRERYNALVTIGNRHCGKIPDHFLAARAGLRPHLLLSAVAHERHATAPDQQGAAVRADVADASPKRDRLNWRLTPPPLSPVVVSPSPTAVELLP